MFKKTLIAAAVVATTATFGANAATVTSASSDAYNVEFAAIDGQVVAPTVTVTTGRDFNDGDIIQITFAGATVATLDQTTKKAYTPTIAGSANIEFLEFDGNSVKALVTDTIASGAAITFAGVQLDISAAADKGKVTVTSLGKVDTVEGAKTVDASTAAATVATFSTQFSAKVLTKFDGVVDVNAARKKFDDASTTDTLIVSTTNAAAADGSATDAVGTYVVHGDFTFLDVDGDGTLEAKEGTITTDGGTGKLAADMMSYTVTGAAASFATGTFGVTVTGAAGSVIPDQTFAIDADVAYKVGTAAGAKELVDAGAAGAWTLNGASVEVPFLPFGSQYSQSVTISNTSTQAGGVDLVVYANGEEHDFEGIATASAKGVTDISAAVRTAVATIGNGNYAIKIIVNAPSASVDVVAVYYHKTDGDRLRTK
jgi:hypothetical protein